jgi:hypothetical protein
MPLQEMRTNSRGNSKGKEKLIVDDLNGVDTGIWNDKRRNTADSHVCPLCQKCFNSVEIEKHAAECPGCSSQQTSKSRSSTVGGSTSIRLHQDKFQKESWDECPFCNELVKSHDLSKHVNELHPEPDMQEDEFDQDDEDFNVENHHPEAILIPDSQESLPPQPFRTLPVQQPSVSVARQPQPPASPRPWVYKPGRPLYNDGDVFSPLKNYTSLRDLERQHHPTVMAMKQHTVANQDMSVPELPAPHFDSPKASSSYRGRKRGGGTKRGGYGRGRYAKKRR